MTEPLEHHDGSTVCELHGEGYSHRPTPYDIERHHIWPLGMGGPDVRANIVRACPTGHSDVHALLRIMIRAKTTEVPERRVFGLGERKYADLAFAAVVVGDTEVRTALGGQP